MSTQEENGQEKGTPKPAGSLKGRLGISKDLQAKTGIPVTMPFKTEIRNPLYPNGYQFPIVNLVNVFFDPAKEVKQPSGETAPTPTLSFTYVDKSNTQKTSTFIEFPIQDDDAKFDTKLAAMQQRIKHIFTVCYGDNEFNEDEFDGDTFAELFENVGKAFNSRLFTKEPKEGEEPTKPVARYKLVALYLKPIYYGTNITLPQYPNFVQRAFDNKGAIPCEFTINPKYDKFVAEEKASAGNLGQYGGGTNKGFGDSTDINDFPDI
jgi:hypothetical protein